jgi:2-keto-4-pentenoate hydratase/2-oxohepta-3-ene-1,7-dioic acid hydratase in catechol pathway
MKIICIGKNYAQHATEMDGAVPNEPLFFMKPETALLPANSPFELPSFSDEIHHEAEVVVRISRHCQNVSIGEAKDAYDAVSLGIDFTARDIQRELKASGHPWEKSKAFDGSAAVSDRWTDLQEVDDPNEMAFQLSKNGALVQSGNTRQMVFGFDGLLSYCSRFITLNKGTFCLRGRPQVSAPCRPATPSSEQKSPIFLLLRSSEFVWALADSYSRGDSVDWLR